MRHDPFYPIFTEDWLASASIAVMKPEQEGAYARLLFHAWNHPTCSLPSRDRELAGLSRLGSRWGKLKGEILACFEPHPTLPDRLINPRQFAIWTERQAFVSQRSEAGKRSATYRWGTGRRGPRGGNDSGNGNGDEPLTEPETKPPRAGNETRNARATRRVRGAQRDGNESGNGRMLSSSSSSREDPNSDIDILTQSRARAGSHPGPGTNPDRNRHRNRYLETPEEEELYHAILEVTGESDHFGLRVVYGRYIARLARVGIDRALSIVKGRKLEPSSSSLETPGAYFNRVCQNVAKEYGVSLQLDEA